jgi:ribokinase
MSKIIVAGITKFETIVHVDRIPFDSSEQIYQFPVFVGGGGDAYNSALALTWLRDKVYYMSIVGRDQDVKAFNPPGSGVDFDVSYILQLMDYTPTEVIFYDDDQRQLIFEDLKGIRNIAYDMSMVRPVMADADCLMVSNANFCRPFVREAVHQQKPICLNIRNYKKEKEKYNFDFLDAASIMYFSDDNVEGDPFEFIKDIYTRFSPKIIILGQGSKGLILYDRDRNINVHYNAVTTNKVVNTAGAGNALIASFLHYYLETGDSVNAIKNGLLCASYKTGFERTSDGYMTPEQVAQWRNLIWHTEKVTDLYGL